MVGLKIEQIIKEDRVIMSYTTAVARMLSAQEWRTEDCPSEENWKVKLSKFMDMDKLTRQIRGESSEQNNTKWSKWGKYMVTSCL